jgi:hypothetical protein
MYFVAAGEVEIDLPERCVGLGAGHFFGFLARGPSTSLG